VDAILAATARVLVDEGYERATTNRIAEVAGVSVGSLYQYFPNKQALVAALIHSHCEEMMRTLAETATTMIDAPLPLAVRHYIRAMLAAHAVAPKLHQVLVHHALQFGVAVWREFDHQCIDLVRAYLEHRFEEIVPQDKRTAAFVLVTAVEAITHRAVVERPEELTSQALEDEICALVLRYLLGGKAE
jgi:AcrR family transcriptional regulator